MLYLITGGNGAGKTLNGLNWAKELADKESRPVAYNGRFDIKPEGPLKNWKKIDFKDWQAEPDGTIFFIDECHNDLPNRGTGSVVPEYVRMLAEHRKRGFDFFLITQHPQNIDVFVRRLIASPGYHRHLKRVFGAELVSVLEWSAVNPQCERPGSGESGTVKTVPFPKQVYDWYTSAQLHTGKRTIPKAVYMLAAIVLAVPVLGYYTFKSLSARSQPASVLKGPAAGAPAAGGAPQRGPAVQSPQAYVEVRQPRIEGLPYTAPHYDELTRPQDAPYPAACVSGRHRGGKLSCHCYTQQGTKLPTPQDICNQIVENGFFIDWKKAEAQAGSVGREPQAKAAPAPSDAQHAGTGATIVAPSFVTSGNIAPSPPAKSPL